jgi:ATP-dependent DNA helicase DinG
MNISDYFTPNGKLAQKHKAYEDRPQQKQMAEAVARVIRKGGQLMVEAGTGVGKSLAYLIPAFVALHERKAERVVISTATKNLQHQLMTKDIPLVQSLFDEELKVVQAVGRGNFVSLRRLQVALKARQKLFSNDDESQALQIVAKWSGRTNTGLLEEIPSSRKILQLIGDRIESDSFHCMYDQCPNNQQCHFQKMKKQMDSANVIVINHAYLLTLLAIEAEFNKGAMPCFDVLIIDEAHRLEDMATETLGLRVSNYALNRFLERLYSPKKRRGLLAGYADKATVELIAGTREAVSEFFEDLKHWSLQEMANKKNGNNYGGPARSLRITRQPPVDASSVLANLRNLQDAIACAGGKADTREHRFEITSAGKRCAKIADAIEKFMQPSYENVHWVSFEEDGKKKDRIELRVAPVNAGEELQRLLYSQPKSVILTSATLTTGNSKDFSLFQECLGLEGCETLHLGSPFDFHNQVKLYLYTKLPDPRNRDDTFVREVSQEIKKLIQETDGQAFVLFTSIADMKRFAEVLRPWLQEHKHELFEQHSQLDRNEMLERFKKTPRAVLFGVSSFWDGVDVPGKALSNVIIVKLPFDVPEEPLIKARCEAYERKHGKGEAFSGYSLPRAILRLRQGFGRLIRTKTDTGIVAILDPRILTADYGPLILEALPTCQTYIDGVLQQVTGDVVGNTSATRRKGRRGRGKSLTEGSGTL